MTPREPIIKPRSKTALPASLYPSSVCRRQAEAVIRRLLEMDDADIPEVVAGPPACAHAMTKAISPGQLSLISGAIGRLDFIVDSSVEYKGYQLVGSDEMLTVVSVPARRFLWVIDWPRLAGDLRSTFITAISQPESRIVFIGNAGPMDPATLRLLAKHGIESELRACTHWHHAAPGTQPGVGDPTIGHRIFYCEGPGQPARLSMRHEASVRRLIRRRLALQLQAGGQRADNSKRRLDDLVDRCLRPPLPLGHPPHTRSARAMHGADPYRGATPPRKSVPHPYSKRIDPVLWLCWHYGHCKICTPPGSPRATEPSPFCYIWDLLRRLIYGLYTYTDQARGLNVPSVFDVQSNIDPWMDDSPEGRAVMQQGIKNWQKVSGSVVDIPGNTRRRPATCAPLSNVVKGADRFKLSLKIARAKRAVTEEFAPGPERALRLAEIDRTMVVKCRTVMLLNVASNDAYKRTAFTYDGVEHAVGMLADMVRQAFDGLTRTERRRLDEARRRGSEEHQRVLTQLMPVFTVLDISSFFIGIPRHPQHNPEQFFLCPLTETWKCLIGLCFGGRLFPYYACCVSSEMQAIMGGHLASLRLEAEKAPKPKNARCGAKRARKKRGKGRSRGRHLKPEIAYAQSRSARNFYVDDMFLGSMTMHLSKTAARLSSIAAKELGFGFGAKTPGISASRGDYLGYQVRCDKLLEGKPCVEVTITPERATYVLAQITRVLAEWRAWDAQCLQRAELPEEGPWRPACDAEIGRRFKPDCTKISGCPLLVCLDTLTGILEHLASVCRGTKARISALHELKAARRKKAPVHVQIVIAAEARNDLRWFRHYLRADGWVGSRVVDLNRPMAILSFKSDASGHLKRGWGYHALADRSTGIDPDLLGTHDQGFFTAQQHSDWKSAGGMLTKEFWPVLQFLRRHGAALEGAIVMPGVDNAGIATCIDIFRARDRYTRAMLKEVGDILIKHDIILIARWCCREFNFVADRLAAGFTFEQVMAHASEVKWLDPMPARAPCG